MPRVWCYEITGETPSKKNGQTFNAITKTMVKKASFREWHKRALTLLQLSRKPEKPLPFARISVTFKHADLRRRDGDGGLASIQDLLQDAGVILDDCWTRIGTPSVYHEIAIKPSVLVEVEEAEDPGWAKRLKALQQPKKSEKKKVVFNANL